LVAVNLPKSIFTENLEWESFIEGNCRRCTGMERQGKYVQQRYTDDKERIAKKREKAG
jgi:hypothetical protein